MGKKQLRNAGTEITPVDKHVAVVEYHRAVVLATDETAQTTQFRPAETDRKHRM